MPTSLSINPDPPHRLFGLRGIFFVRLPLAVGEASGSMSARLGRCQASAADGAWPVPAALVRAGRWAIGAREVFALFQF